MLESILRYNSIVQPIAEIEDPPETMHMPWGVWLHHSDALHRIEQRYDTKHMLRAARAADDILHYANYVPKIGEDEQKIESHAPNFEYNYSHEEHTYDVNIELEEEDAKSAETTINIGLEESITSNNKHEEVEHNEGDNLSVDGNLKDDNASRLKKDLITILKNFA